MCIYHDPFNNINEPNLSNLVVKQIKYEQNDAKLTWLVRHFNHHTYSLHLHFVNFDSKIHKF